MNEELNNHQDENKLIAERRAKLKALRERGIAFPNDFRRNATAGELHASYGEMDDAALATLNLRVSVAGRVMLKRIMGKVSFLQLKDMAGQIQLFVQRDAIGADVYDDFKRWDIGDIVGTEGVLFRTKAGELSVRVDSIRLLTKSLRPLPEKWQGLSDQETRYRQRYLDLIANDSSRQVFRVRSQIIQLIREFMVAYGFLEVETPMMHVIPGGATARPFVTHHNALGIDLYLRVAPELYLKRLVVGGFERVFEINRSFRNEGLSSRHNPEFTMIEFYQAYADYKDLMDLTEEMMRSLARDVLASTKISYQGQEFDFGSPFKRMTMLESILSCNPGITAEQLNDLAEASIIASKLGAEVKPAFGLGKVQSLIFEETVEHKLIQPTFITAYPTEISPLARLNDDDPMVTDRFEFFIGGREIANGFSELNDPEDQAERFRKQVLEKEAGDDEAMHFDEDYIVALEHGMPPTAGEGIGIDRLVMLFTDAPSIRDVLLFPHMRPA
ncbi:MAG: lysine--tRNA ligase [Thiohalomonadaceae bacterium]